MRSRSRLAPATLEQVAPLLIAAGAAFCLAGGIDALLFLFPASFGDSNWEFGTIGQLMDTLPLPTIGVLLLAVGIRALGTRPIWTRILTAATALVALLLAGMIVIFLLDLPIAWKSMSEHSGVQATALVRAGLQRGIVKAFLLLLGYLGCYVTMTIALWRSPKDRRASEG